MVNAFLFDGPADGQCIVLLKKATTLDIQLDNDPYRQHRYIVYSNNQMLSETVNQIFKYQGVTP